MENTTRPPGGFFHTTRAAPRGGPKESCYSLWHHRCRHPNVQAISAQSVPNRNAPVQIDPVLR